MTKFLSDDTRGYIWHTKHWKKLFEKLLEEAFEILVQLHELERREV